MSDSRRKGIRTKKYAMKRDSIFLRRVNWAASDSYRSLEL